MCSTFTALDVSGLCINDVTGEVIATVWGDMLHVYDLLTGRRVRVFGKGTGQEPGQLQLSTWRTGLCCTPPSRGGGGGGVLVADRYNDRLSHFNCGTGAFTAFLARSKVRQPLLVDCNEDFVVTCTNIGERPVYVVSWSGDVLKSFKRKRWEISGLHVLRTGNIGVFMRSLKPAGSSVLAVYTASGLHVCDTPSPGRLVRDCVDNGVGDLMWSPLQWNTNWRLGADTPCTCCAREDVIVVSPSRTWILYYAEKRTYNEDGDPIAFSQTFHVMRSPLGLRMEWVRCVTVMAVMVGGGAARRRL